MLWSDAFRTVTPPTATGSSSAAGVRTPVRPTDGKMFRIFVVAWRGLNFQATAQRGERDTCPRRRCRPRSFTLTTTPSISNGRSSRPAAEVVVVRRDGVEEIEIRRSAARASSPNRRTPPASSAYVAKVAPSTSPTP
jgi:hypothetical protein